MIAPTGTQLGELDQFLDPRNNIFRRRGFKCERQQFLSATQKASCRPPPLVRSKCRWPSRTGSPGTTTIGSLTKNVAHRNHGGTDEKEWLARTHPGQSALRSFLCFLLPAALCLKIGKGNERGKLCFLGPFYLFFLLAEKAQKTLWITKT